LEGRSGEFASLWEKVGVIEYWILALALPSRVSLQANSSAPATVNFT
jgi:hypothetical protein